jgi:hypothetical protein
MPERIQRHRTKGWRMPEGAVYVGRRTKWGNPFAFRTPAGLARVPAALSDAPWEYEDRISAAGMSHNFFHPGGRMTAHTIRYLTRAECVDLYRTALVTPTTWSRLWDRSERRALTVEDVRTELAGKDLACWCPLNQPCHADVLLELANAEENQS